MAAPHAVTRASVSPHQPPASPVCVKRTQLRHCCPRLKAAKGSRRINCKSFDPSRPARASSGWPPSPRSTMKFNPDGPDVRRRVALRQPVYIARRKGKCLAEMGGQGVFRSITTTQRSVPASDRQRAAGKTEKQRISRWISHDHAGHDHDRQRQSGPEAGDLVPVVIACAPARTEAKAPCRRAGQCCSSDGAAKGRRRRRAERATARQPRPLPRLQRRGERSQPEPTMQRRDLGKECAKARRYWTLHSA